MVALDKLTLGIIAFFLFIVGGVFFVHDLEANYVDENIDMELDYYINDTYKDATDNPIEKKMNVSSGNATFDLSKDMQDRMFGKEVDEENTEDSMFSGAFSVTRLITTPVRLIDNVANEVTNNMGIPEIFKGYGIAALVISVIFGVIYLIFRVKS